MIKPKKYRLVSSNVLKSVLMLLAALFGMYQCLAQNLIRPTPLIGTNVSVFEWSNPLPFQYREEHNGEHTELRDPCIIRDNDTYYVAFTMWPFGGREASRVDQPNQGGSPGIAIYSSTNLEDWRFDNWLVKSSELPENCPYKDRFWAPEIHHFGNKYYLIFYADNWLKNECNPAGKWSSAGYAFVGEADKVTGPYKHITWINGAGCDTTLFQDTDGKTYAIIPRYNIDVQQIDLGGLAHDHVKLIGKPKTIVFAKNTDIGIAANPDYLEGPWMEKIKGKYYLFYAEIYRDKTYADWLGYWTGVAVADSVMGPYKKDRRGKIFAGGHLAIFRGPNDGLWFSYRGESDNSAHGRLCIDPLTVDAQGAVQTIAPTIGQQSVPGNGYQDEIKNFSNQIQP
jgi:beta-xylosidase